MRRHRPAPALRARRLLFKSVHAQLGGGLRLFATAGAFLPPALQQAWEDIGVIVLQGYGATETGAGCATTMDDHPLGCVGVPPKPVQMRVAGTARSSSAALRCSRATGTTRTRPPRPSPRTAGTCPATWASSTGRARLHLHGRKKDIIVLPNGFNVYPEDIENAMRVAGIRDSVAVETRPGRIEAVVLAPGTHGDPADKRAASAIESSTPDDLRRQIEAAVKAANASLGPNQRIAGWRLWPEADFPRTHTFKVKRDRVRTWAAVDTPLPVDEDGGASGSQG